MWLLVSPGFRCMFVSINLLPVFHFCTLNLESSWIYTIPFQPSSIFYYIIVINSTRFKICVSSVNVHRFINIYIYIKKNVKKSEKLMEIVNIDGKDLHIFWTTWGISVKFSEKNVAWIILIATKKPRALTSL